LVTDIDNKLKRIGNNVWHDKIITTIISNKVTNFLKSALISPMSLIISGATPEMEDFLEWIEDFCARFIWLK
jgi:hypothetical protein